MFGSDIPQLLHITEKDYNSLQGPVLQHLSLVVRNLKQLFPNLIIKFWDDNAVNALFQQAPTGFAEFAQAFRLLNPVYGCTRADLFRYLVMFLEGGLYYDCKSGCDEPDEFAAHAPLAPLVLTHWGH